MKPGKIYLHPSKFRSPFFDGMELSPAQINLSCGNCQEKIQKDLWHFLARTFDLPDSFEQDHISAIEESFKLQKAFINYKTCDDLHASFGLIQCASCQHQHLLCIGFSEIQPARYRASLQGVCEIES